MHDRAEKHDLGPKASNCIDIKREDPQNSVPQSRELLFHQESADHVSITPISEASQKQPSPLLLGEYTPESIFC